MQPLLHRIGEGGADRIPENVDGPCVSHRSEVLGSFPVADEFVGAPSWGAVMEGVHHATRPSPAGARRRQFARLAQAQFFWSGTAGTSVKVSADEVVARIMTFDQNNDGRVGVAELSERMRPLVARGDLDNDEALDRNEVRALAVTPVTQTGRIFGGSGGYSFGDEAGLSSRLHIEGALEDLRLTSDRKDRALPIVRSYVEHIENTARANLLSQMETLLSPEQLVVVTRALDAQQHQISLRTNTGDGQRVVRLAMGLGNLTRRLEAMGLGAPSEQARAAVEQYKSRIRLGSEEERAELMARLKDVLTGEELDDYNAALQRRPVVANSFMFAMNLNEAANALREQTGRVVPAVLIERIERVTAEGAGTR